MTVAEYPGYPRRVRAVGGAVDGVGNESRRGQEGDIESGEERWSLCRRYTAPLP